MKTVHKYLSRSHSCIVVGEPAYVYSLDSTQCVQKTEPVQNVDTEFNFETENCIYLVTSTTAPISYLKPNFINISGL